MFLYFTCLLLIIIALLLTVRQTKQKKKKTLIILPFYVKNKNLNKFCINISQKARVKMNLKN